MTNSKVNKAYTFAVGRRKTASARVRLFKGTGENSINNSNEIELIEKILNPFKLTNTLGKYYFTAKVAGGGKEGQAEAVVLGISRALAKVDPEKYRSILKKNNLLTRDSRSRLRRMVGTGGKARRRKQSPKR